MMTLVPSKMPALPKVHNKNLAFPFQLPKEKNLSIIVNPFPLSPISNGLSVLAKPNQFSVLVPHSHLYFPISPFLALNSHLDHCKSFLTDSSAVFLCSSLHYPYILASLSKKELPFKMYIYSYHSLI